MEFDLEFDPDADPAALELLPAGEGLTGCGRTNCDPPFPPGGFTCVGFTSPCIETVP